MSMTQEEFIEKSGAEVVGGRLIVGMQGDRIIVGETEPVFALNEDGKTLMADLEAGETTAEAVADMTAARTVKANGAAGANANVKTKKTKAAAPVEPTEPETPAAPTEPAVPASNPSSVDDIAAEAARIAAEAAQLAAGH